MGKIALLTSLVSFSYVLRVIVALPTWGHIQRNRLETYEDVSGEPDDFDLFENLTFRFTCENRSIGLYADADYNCRIFHACDNFGAGFPVLCPNDTFFDQKQRICTDEENSDCEHAEEWYHLNEQPYSGEITEEYEVWSEEKRTNEEKRINEEMRTNEEKRINEEMRINEENEDVLSVLPLVP